MVTVYTERGRVQEAETLPLLRDYRKERVMRLAAISLGTGLLLSLVAAFNLNADISSMQNYTMPALQQQIDQYGSKLIFNR